MNAAPAEPPPFPEAPPAGRWSWKRLFLLVLLAFLAHLAIVFLLGARKTAAPRPVVNVPTFQLADSDSELVRLTDPTLFVMPHAEDLTPGIWALPVGQEPVFSWTAPPPPAYLAPAADTWGTVLNAFLQTNQPANVPFNFKPEPQWLQPQVATEFILPQNSSWQIAGEIIGRRMLNSFSAPTLAVNDVLAPSRVQLLVDTDGTVASDVLLDSSGYDPTDLQALELARTLRFAPAEKLALGEITFNWHTVPVATTNAP